MSLRDFLIEPRDAGRAGEAAAYEAADARGEVALGGAAVARGGFVLGRLRFSDRRRAAPAAAGVAPSIAVLATARELAAVAVAVGVVVARRCPAALVCVHAPGGVLPAPAVRAPARAAAARLAASLRARGLAADARGRVAVVDLGLDERNGADAIARSLAAGGALPTVVALAARDPDLDVLLAAQDAVLLALPPSIDPTLAELAASSAARLAPRATSITLNLDPASRALALAGLRVPAALRTAVEGVIA